MLGDPRDDIKKFLIETYFLVIFISLPYPSPSISFYQFCYCVKCLPVHRKICCIAGFGQWFQSLVQGLIGTQDPFKRYKKSSCLIIILTIHYLHFLH